MQKRYRDDRIRYQELGKLKATPDNILFNTGCMLYWAEGSTMKCNVCFSVMENRDERHAFGLHHIRMNLNCLNMKCPARTQVQFGTHMGVLLHYNDPWKCHEYHLPFSIGRWWFILEGRDNGSTSITPRNIPIEDYFKISRYISKPVGFISISTGDDMHEHAWDVFEQLTKELKRLSHFS